MRPQEIHGRGLQWLPRRRWRRRHGPPLTNQVWIYGKDDDTLFRIVALGSDGLKAHGYARKGSENVVGPMPAMGEIVKTADDMWKIIAWIRSVNPSSASASAKSPPPAE